MKKLLVVAALCSLTIGGSGGRASAVSATNGSLTVVRMTYVSDSPWDVRSKILAVAADGSRIRRLYTGQRGAFAVPGSWSPDGSLLVFSTRFAHLDRCSVKVLDPVTGMVATILPEHPEACVGRLAWSPDGQRLLVYTTSSLMTIAPDGTDPRPIPVPTQGSLGAGYDWSPDGTRIVYAQETMSRLHRIVVMDGDGTDPVRITRCGRWVCREGLGDSSPRWSPDGSAIAFIRANNLYLVSPDGTNLRRITDCPETLRDSRCRYQDPIWSPDGTSLAYTYDGAVWTMDPDGSHRQRVVEAASTGAWRPRP